MTLGERISSLRAEKNMSQGDLADALGVSRQSVSKWETDASVPELAKLVQLAELFGVTLDYLAGRGAAPDQPGPEAPQAVVICRPGARMIAGAVLLGAGLLWTLLMLALFGYLPLLGAYLAVCGALCLAIKRHAGLVIGWLTMAALIPLTQNFTGIRMFAIFNPAYYQSSAALAPILALAMWLYLAALIAFTARAVKRARK